MKRLLPIVAVALLIGLLVLVSQSRCGTSPAREAREVVDLLIEQAPTPEGRTALKRVSDEAEEDIRRQVAALDEEIQRLRKENAALEKQLAE